MDAVDRKILNKLQLGLTIDENPFRKLADELKIAPEKLIDRIHSLKEKGYIRRLGGVMNSSKLGYDSTLLAARVAEKNFKEVVDKINKHPGVTHNYRRNSRLNVWFTLSTQEKEEREIFLEKIKSLKECNLCFLKKIVGLKGV